MELNGTSHAAHGDMNGRTPKSATPEPSTDEILAFLRGTLADGKSRPIATPPLTDEPATGSAPIAPPMADLPNQSLTAADPTNAMPTAAALPNDQSVTPLQPVAMTFKDTRFSRLTTQPPPPELIAEATVVTPPAPPPAAPTPAPAASEALSSLSSARVSPAPGSGPGSSPFAVPPQRAAAAPHWTAAAMSAPPAPLLDPAATAQPAPAAALSPPPLPPPGQTIIDADFDTVEHATAELLRPVLRQWLSENMPRIVEKALRIELAPPSARGKLQK